MTQEIIFPALDANVIRVFAINLAEDEVHKALSDPAQQTALVATLLGAPLDTPEQAEIIAIADLEEIGLTGFLLEGAGVPPETLAPHKTRLAALDGFVLLTYPNLFTAETTVKTGPDLTFIAALSTDAPDWSAARTLQSEAATTPAPPTGKKRPSDAAMSGRVAMVALLVIALLTWLMIWIA